MHTPDADFGARLREARRAAGMSQAELADGLSTPSFLSLVESGKRSPSPKLAEALAARVGIAVDAATAAMPPQEALLALAALRAGDLERAERQAAALADGSAERLLVQGLLLEHRGQLTDSTLTLERALSGSGHLPELRAEAATALCRVAYNAGNLPLAIEVGESLLATPASGRAREDDLRVEIRATLSGVYCDSGNLARARELVHDDADVRTPTQRGQQLWARAIVALNTGDAVGAAQLAADALQHFRSGDNPLALARLQVTAAMLERNAGRADAETALAQLAQAEAAFRRLGAHLDLAGCLTASAHLEAGRGAHARARTQVEEALLLVRDEGAGMRARIYAAAAIVFLAVGDRPAADAHLLEARALLEAAGAHRAAAATWRQMAATYEEMGALDLALACMKAATDLLGVHHQSSAGAHAAM